MSDTAELYDFGWKAADRVTVEKIEVAVLDIPYSAHTDDGLQEGVPGDYLVRAAGDDDQKNWRVVPAHIGAETIVPHLVDEPEAAKPAAKPRASRKKASA